MSGTREVEQDNDSAEGRIYDQPDLTVLLSILVDIRRIEWYYIILNCLTNSSRYDSMYAHRLADHGIEIGKSHQLVHRRCICLNRAQFCAQFCLYVGVMGESV